MVLIMFGAPGVGKGSQAAVLSGTFQIPHISTGGIFRENVANETTLGKIAKSYMDRGALVPDEITIDIIMGRVLQNDCRNGFILDGFPRTLFQAKHLDELLAEHSFPVNAIINITLEDELIISRLSGRRVCPSCNLVYHLEHNKPSRAERCDRCNGTLIQRADDTETTIRKRLEIYHDQTKSLLAYYRTVHPVFDIESQSEISETTKHIFEALEIPVS